MYTVYRYEDSTGVGPYATDIEKYDDLSATICRAHQAEKDKDGLLIENHPCIRRDLIGRMIQDDDFCACPDLETLYKWFNGFNRKLVMDGFVIKEIVVNKVTETESKKQLTFKKNDIVSEKILAVNLEELI